MQIVDDEDATSDPFSMSVVGTPMNAHCFPQPVGSRTIMDISKQPCITSVGRETDREWGYICHSWLATRPADYVLKKNKVLLHLIKYLILIVNLMK